MSRQAPKWMKPILTLIQSGDADALADAAIARFVLLSEPLIRDVTEKVTLESFDVDIVIRCIAHRGLGSIKALQALTRQGSGFYALSFLRPLIEDLIYASYLTS